MELAPTPQTENAQPAPEKKKRRAWVKPALFLARVGIQVALTGDIGDLDEVLEKAAELARGATGELSETLTELPLPPKAYE
ncbi:hypothetical protein AB0P41_35525 [Streptomyces sp. NPDC079167]|uniref:hypothetical protein n=1 Tax=Streptomyces sp. NPDC079167 TaxID=3154513 RepID=UPI00342FB18F